MGGGCLVAGGDLAGPLDVDALGLLAVLFGEYVGAC